jgi:hypothetical protein
MPHIYMGKGITRNTGFIGAVETLELQSAQQIQWQQFHKISLRQSKKIHEMEHDLFPIYI